MMTDPEQIAVMRKHCRMKGRDTEFFSRSFNAGNVVPECPVSCCGITQTGSYGPVTVLEGLSTLCLAISHKALLYKVL